MKLKIRIGLMLIPLILIPLLVAGSVTFSVYQQQYRDKTVHYMDAYVDDRQRLLQKELDGAQATLALLEQSPALRQYLWADEYTRSQILYPSLLRTFRGYQNAFPQYQQIGLFNNRGQPAVISRRQLPGQGEVLWPPLAPLQHQLGSQPGQQFLVLKGPDGAPWLAAGKPLWLNRSASDLSPGQIEHLGYLAIQLSSRVLQEMVSIGEPGKGGFSLISDTDGTVLFAPPGLESYQHPSSLATALQQAAGPITTLTLGGNQYHAVARELLPELYLIALLPSDEFYQALLGIALQVGGYYLLLVIVLLVIIYTAVNRQLVQPIQRLHQATMALSSGDTGFLASGRRDELGQLELSFERLSRNLRRSTGKLQKMAYEDRLTGLANRHRLQQQLHQLVQQPEPFALIFMDLDGFKTINDSYGHDIGDRILIALSERFRLFSQTLEGDTEITGIARLGGDEFTLLLRGELSPEAISLLLNHLAEGLRRPVVFGKQHFTLSASFGIARFPDDGQSATELLKNADLAMYQAKAGGKAGHAFYEHSAAVLMRYRARLARDLPDALSKEQLILYMQPIVHTADESLAGFEALLRWQHPELGMVMPGDFIPVAEETGLISDLGAWVIEQSCRYHERWSHDGRQLHATVNVSSLQLNNDVLMTTLRRCLQQYAIAPASLFLELTETTLMHLNEAVRDKLHQIRLLGVNLAVDDFGTGHSSLHRLQMLPITMLKIDRSFISRMELSHTSETIVKTVLAMARELEYLVVAEGVETASQAQRMRQLQCQYLQGFRYGKPMAAEEFERQWLTVSTTSAVK